MLRHILAATTSLTVAVATTGPAFAQTLEDEIIVTGRYLSLNSVNAVKTPTPLVDVPQSLSVITADQINDQAFTGFDDVLRYTPGLSISQGEGHRDAIIIRGQQTTADFFIDGIRDDVQYYRPLYNVAQIEILRGSNALLFGRGGAGGIINRVSKTPEAGERFTDLTLAADTLGGVMGALDINAAASERSGFRLNAFYEGLNNHRDAYDGRRFGLNPTALIQLGANTVLDVSYEYLDDDRVVDRGVPSVAGPGVLEPLRGFDDTFFGGPTNDTQLQAHIARAHAEHRFNDLLRMNATVQFADYDKAYQNLYPSEAVELDAAGSPIAVELDGYRDTTDRQNLVAQVNFVGEFDTGALGHTVLFGAEYADQDTRNARLDNVFAANGDDQLLIDFTDPLTVPAFGFTDPARDRASDVEALSLYLQDQIDLTDRFKVLLGGRYDRFAIDVDDVIAGARFARTDEEFTPRLGAIYKPAQDISLYASYSETFLPRSGDQFLTLNLDTASTRPQVFENREAGVKWDINPALALTAAVFRLDRENFTSVDPEDPGQVIVISGSRTDGAEFQLSGQLSERWRVETGYSYLDGAVRGGGQDGNATRQTPTHMASLWTEFDLSERWGFGAGATYQDSYFVREDNSVRVPDYLRVDAAAYYVVNDALRLQLNVENLTDTDYFPSAHSNTNISTGEPLNARLAVRTRF